MGIDSVKNVEEQLLSRISFPNKQPQYNLCVTLKKNAMKFLSYNNFISIKITGIWIQHTSYGVSYKIIQ
jgi:2-hydroxy-3-keto-5-methylthiopentenyl-1-phosphate phosphatase